MSGNISVFQDCPSSSVRCLLTVGTGNIKTCQSLLAQLPVSALSRNVGCQCVQHSQSCQCDSTGGISMGGRAGRRNHLKKKQFKEITQAAPTGSVTKSAAQVVGNNRSQPWDSKAQHQLPKGKAVGALYLQGICKAIPCAQSILLLPGADSSRNIGINIPCGPILLVLEMSPAPWEPACSRCWWAQLRSFHLWGQGANFLFIILKTWRGKDQNPQKVQSWRNFASVLGSCLYSDCILNLLPSLFLWV